MEEFFMIFFIFLIILAISIVLIICIRQIIKYVKEKNANSTEIRRKDKKEWIENLLNKNDELINQTEQLEEQYTNSINDYNKLIDEYNNLLDAYNNVQNKKFEKKPNNKTKPNNNDNNLLLEQIDKQTKLDVREQNTEEMIKLRKYIAKLEEANAQLQTKIENMQPETMIPLQETKKTKTYTKKESFISDPEKAILNKLQNLFKDKYVIQCQIPLRQLVKTLDEQKYHNELHKYLDFGLFTKEYEPALIIELNDKTHKQADRHQRDLKVKEILEEANIPLLTIYTNMPNDEEWLYNEITKTIAA